jgi:hypothetical protein
MWGKRAAAVAMVATLTWSGRGEAQPRSLSLGVNPLAFLLGRFGGDVEYLFAKYLALVGNLHLDGSLFGFFFGPSLVAGYYSVNYYGYAFPLPDVGFAFDLGGKLHVGDRGFIALGAGFQYTNTPRYEALAAQPPLWSPHGL